MKAKVIKVDETGEEIEVCIRLECDADGNDFVKISAWKDSGDGGRIYHENQISFGTASNNFEMCERYIDDFSDKTAQEFVSSLD